MEDVDDQQFIETEIDLEIFRDDFDFERSDFLIW